MNERIRDLQIQAFTECKTFEDDKVRTDDVFKRFAELIVRECAYVSEGYFGFRDNTPGTVIAKEMKEHFGVEE